MNLFIIVLMLISSLVYGSQDDDDDDELYPNRDLTPGETFPEITRKELCKPRYSRHVRNVSTALKREVKLSYGIHPDDFGEYTIDHFIPLSLGGTNNKENLWPQRVKGPYGATEKAKSDFYLYEQFCNGKITLEEAHRLIRKDWVKVYQNCCEQRSPQRRREEVVITFPQYIRVEYDLEFY